MITALLIAVALAATTADEPAWSNPAVVVQGSQPVVRFQTRIFGDYLFVRAIHEKDWHTYAMDNQVRATKALKGKKSLGIEQGIDIRVKSGLKLEDQWSQTRPRDLSKPELRWYTYGFEQTALFACRIKAVTNEAIVVQIRGQACSDESCCNIDVTIELKVKIEIDENTPGQGDRVMNMLKDLVPVAEPSSAATDES